MPWVWRESLRTLAKQATMLWKTKVASLIMKLEARYIYELKRVIEYTFSKSCLAHSYDF